MNNPLIAYSTDLTEQGKDAADAIFLMWTCGSGPFSRSLVEEIRRGRLTKRDAGRGEWVAEGVPECSTQPWDRLGALAPRLNYAAESH